MVDHFADLDKKLAQKVAVLVCADCGDGIINGVEQCDDGNPDNTDACLNNCRNATCGDGVTRTDQGNTEECDYAVDADCTTTCIKVSSETKRGLEDGSEDNDGSWASSAWFITLLALLIVAVFALIGFWYWRERKAEDFHPTDEIINNSMITANLDRTVDNESLSRNSIVV